MSATDSLRQRGARYVPEIAGNSRLASRHRYLIARELATNKTVLNIACGDGSGADLLATVARSAIGVDPDPELIQQASQRYRRSNLTFRAGSCTAIPVIETSIDLVVFVESIERELRHARIIAELRRVLAPGGVLVLSTVARTCGVGELDRLVHAHFPYVAVASQRMHGGSLVGPVNGQHYSRFVTFREEGDDVQPVAGLDAPEYLIAFASEAPLPAMPIGAMEGEAVAAIDQPPIDVSVDALVQRVADLARLHLRERQRLADLRGATGRLHEAIDQHRAEAMAAWDQIRAREARIAELEQNHALDLESERAAHRQRLAEVERGAADRSVRSEAFAAYARAREAELLALVEQMSGAAAIGETRLAAMERSHSWRFTRPLRDFRRLLSRIARVG